MSEVEAARFRGLARGELEVAQAWLNKGNLRLHRAHLQEALRLEVLARSCEGLLSALETATAVVKAESWESDVDALIRATKHVLE